MSGVWGLIFWCSFAYRKKTDELPKQVRYNLPVEILYTVVPFVIVGGLFYYTARDESKIDQTPKPDMTVSVVGFRWNWSFSYLEKNAAGQGGPEGAGHGASRAARSPGPADRPQHPVQGDVG